MRARTAGAACGRGLANAQGSPRKAIRFSAWVLWAALWAAALPANAARAPAIQGSASRAAFALSGPGFERSGEAVLVAAAGRGFAYPPGVAFQIILAPRITTSSLPDGLIGQTYSATLAASGGAPPYRWEIREGPLPPGLAINASSGAISGTPSRADRYRFTAVVIDRLARSDDRNLAITVAAPRLAITTTSLANGVVGEPYSQTLQATGAPPFSWQVISGNLPPGLTLGSSGALAGTPSAAGSYNFRVQVRDSAGTTDSRAYTVNIAAALAIVTAALPNASLGTRYSQTLEASGGAPPYRWRVAGGSLPPGLTMDSTGSIGGVPSGGGTYSFTAEVSDSTLAVASRSFSLTVVQPLVINTSSLPGATAGTPYSQTLSAAGGAPPYRWTIATGSLPPGLNLNPDSGSITGSPSSAGNFSFTVRVSDSALMTATKDLSIAVIAPLDITTTSLPAATAGVSYSQTLAATGGAPPYSWSLAQGALPAGLTLNASGGIAGTPAAAGTGSFTVRVTDSASAVDTAALSIEVRPPLAIQTDALPGGAVGTAYTASLAATGGVPPYGWSVTSGALPPGLSVGSDGALSGTPTAAGQHSFTVQVTDAASVAVARPLSIQIQSSLAIVTSSLPSAVRNRDYNQQLAASGGAPPYTWSVTAGQLPGGLDLNAQTGVISGRPTSMGRSTFTVRAADSAGQSASAPLAISVASNVTITTTELPAASTGIRYSQTLSVSGASGAVSWALVDGMLPPGLDLNRASGVISGTPTTAGNFLFSVQASDESGGRSVAALSISITSGLTITSTSPLPAGAVGTAYSQALAAIGGAPPFSWAVDGGSLPGGLTLNPDTGLLSGTPTTAGSYNFTLRVTDSRGDTQTKSFAMTVVSALTISTESPLPGGPVNVPYSQRITALAGTPPYAWSIASGSLPQGLTLNASTGDISGTPTRVGASTFTVRVTDALNRSVTKAFRLAIGEALSISTASPLPGGTAGAPYSQTFAAAGGTPPYRWSITQGALPAGLALNAETGALAGAPAEGGNFTFTVQALDAIRVTATKAFTLSVGVGSVPAVSFNNLPATVEPLQQPQVDVSLASPYNLPITGQLALSFQPDAVTPADDPAIQFATGGRTVSFTIPPNTTDAVFAEPEMAFQTGTVAGNIILSVQLRAGGVDVPAPAPKQMRIARSGPVVRSARVVRTTSGFEVWITGYSPSRELTQASFRFTAAPGGSLQTSEVNVNLSESAGRWYQDAASALYGSQFTVIQPFTVQGDAAGIRSVTVTLTNASGTSQPATADF